MRVQQVWRIFPALALLFLLALAMPLVPAFAQDSGSIISIDTPTDGQTADIGSDVIFRGWAGNALGPGTGVDKVIVLDAPQAAGGVTLAEATYGGARGDVGQAYGAAMTNSAFVATWRAAGVPGNKTFWVYAHSVANDGWTNKTVTVRLTAPVAPPPPPAPTAQPQQPSGNYNDNNYNNDNRVRGQNGLYGNNCDPYYNNQYGNGYYGNQYGNQSINQNCNSYNNGYNSGYNGGYNSGYPYDGYTNPYYGNGYGSPYTSPYINGVGNATCSLPGNGYYVNTLTGQQYSTYAQCIASSGGYNTGTGTCVQQSSGYYYNPLTGQQYSTYAQCIAYGGGSGVASCSLQANGYYYNTATGQSYSSYSQCIAYTSGGAANCVLQANGLYYNTGTGASYTTYNQCIGGTTNVTTCTLLNGVYYNSTTGNTYTTYDQCINNGVIGTVAPPTNLTFGAKSNTTITLTWTPSVTGSITNYQVQQSATGVAGTFVNSAVVGLTASGATVTGLLPNTTYFFQVIAQASNGISSVPSNSTSTNTNP